MAIGVLQAGGKTVFQFGDLGGEGGVEVDAETLGKHEKPPEALGQLVSQIFGQITRMNPASLSRHHQASQLTDVMNEANDIFLVRPRSAVLSLLKLVVELSKLDGALDRVSKSLSRSLVSSCLFWPDVV